MKTPITKGIALHLATSQFDLDHYGDELCLLSSSEMDLGDFRLISEISGFECQTLSREGLTKANLHKSFAKIAKSLKPNDSFLLTFSGLGGMVPCYNSAGYASLMATWCLYDCQLLRSELLMLLSNLQPQVNVVVMADCSTHIKGIGMSDQAPNGQARRTLPTELAERIYLRHKDHYDGISLQARSFTNENAASIFFSACQPNQAAHETKYNGLFTAAIKRVWNGGNFRGDYQAFFYEVSLNMPDYQSPNVEFIGYSHSRILKMKPFAI